MLVLPTTIRFPPTQQQPTGLLKERLVRELRRSDIRSTIFMVLSLISSSTIANDVSLPSTSSFICNYLTHFIAKFWLLFITRFKPLASGATLKTATVLATAPGNS